MPVVNNSSLREFNLPGLNHRTFAGPEHDIDVIIGGRYLDKYTKHDGRWKFSQRTIVADWAYQNDPSQVTFEHPSTRGSLRGKPGQADPSISLFTAPQG